METFKLDVKGMSCGGCTSSVTRAISGLNGVKKVEVTLQPGSATVEADNGCVTAQKIVSTLAAMGYEAQARDEVETGSFVDGQTTLQRSRR